jgi:hypothetical protein
MTQNLDQKKMELIREIMDIEEASLLEKIESDIKESKQQSGIWDKVIKPIRKTISIVELVEEQSYEPIEADAFFELAESIAIEEPLEELLLQLD